MKLKIELVPSTSHYINVRSEVSREQWDIIRKKCYKHANYKCEICGDIGPKHPVECHEIWEYDSSDFIQKLTGFIALCPNCHKTKHAGLASINNEMHIVINQLIKVNNIDKYKAEKYIKECFEQWEWRSQYVWTLNLDYLNNQI